MGFPSMSRAYPDKCTQRFLKWYLFFTSLAPLALFSREIDPFFITHSVMAGAFVLSRIIV